MSMYSDKWGKLSVKIIEEINANRSKILDEYGSISNYIIQREASEMWKEPEIRAEFLDDYECLLAFLRNSHRANV